MRKFVDQELSEIPNVNLKFSWDVAHFGKCFHKNTAKEKKLILYGYHGYENHTYAKKIIERDYTGYQIIIKYGSAVEIEKDIEGYVFMPER